MVGKTINLLYKGATNLVHQKNAAQQQQHQMPNQLECLKTIRLHGNGQITFNLGMNKVNNNTYYYIVYKLKSTIA